MATLEERVIGFGRLRRKEDALAPFGVRHVEMPCTPGRVWEAMQDAR